MHFQIDICYYGKHLRKEGFQGGYSYKEKGYNGQLGGMGVYLVKIGVK